MERKDPRVDACISRSADFAKPILQHLRRLVHSACPDVEETIKWRFPHFVYKGMLCHMAAFKEHCAFGFWHKTLRDAAGAGKDKTAMGQLGRITRLEDLPSDAVLTKWIKQAMKLNDAGIKSPRTVKASGRELIIPESLTQALKTNKKALANFEAMSYSHRKEYAEWIAGAKREETVAKRLATALQWIAEGKSQNWKYEK